MGNIEAGNWEASKPKGIERSNHVVGSLVAMIALSAVTACADDDDDGRPVDKNNGIVNNNTVNNDFPDDGLRKCNSEPADLEARVDRDIDILNDYHSYGMPIYIELIPGAGVPQFVLEYSSNSGAIFACDVQAHRLGVDVADVRFKYINDEKQHVDLYNIHSTYSTVAGFALHDARTGIISSEFNGVYSYGGDQICRVNIDRQNILDDALETAVNGVCN